MQNEQVKIAFLGNSVFSLIVLKELKNLGIFPDVLVTSADKPQGRKMILTPSPTKMWAEENSIEYLTPEKLREENFIKKISSYNLFIVASYGKIIPKQILEIPKYKTLNIHPSLLPKYRGPSPLQEQILNGEKEVGVTIMQIDEQVDHGPIVKQEKIILEDYLGFNDMQEKLAKAGATLLSEILSDWIKGKITVTEQNHSNATFTKKIMKEDGLIDIVNGDPLKNYLKILAFENWPVAFFEIEKNDKKIKVLIKKASFDGQILNIKKVIPEGKKEMDYKSFLNGFMTICHKNP